MKFFLLISLLIATVSGYNECDPSKQSNRFWNSDCTNPEKPYCNGLYGVSGTRCLSCVPSKESYAICDCPANYWCDVRMYSETRGRCVPWPNTGLECTPDDNDLCAIYDTDHDGQPYIRMYQPCINGKCAVCTQEKQGNGTTICPGLDAEGKWTLSSRPGETRRCNASGLFENTGTLDTSLVIAPTSVYRSGSSTSGTTTSTVSLDSILLLVLTLMLLAPLIG